MPHNLLPSSVTSQVPGRFLRPSLQVETWLRYHNALDYIPPHVQVSTLIGPLHDSNPQVDHNPLYSFAGREELPFGTHRLHYGRGQNCWALQRNRTHHTHVL